MFADSPLLPYLMSPLRMTSILRDGCFLIVTDSPLLLCSASSLRVTSRSRGYSSKNDICSLIVPGSLLPPVSLCRDLQAVNSIPAVRCRPFGSVRSHCVMGSLPADSRSPFGSVRSLCVTLLPGAGLLCAVTTRRMTATITVTTADDVGASLQIHIACLSAMDNTSMLEVCDVVDSTRPCSKHATWFSICPCSKRVTWLIQYARARSTRH